MLLPMDEKQAEDLASKLSEGCSKKYAKAKNYRVVDGDTRIPGLEAVGYKILFPYRSISVRDKLSIEREVQSMGLQCSHVRWSHIDYLVIYSEPNPV